MSPDPQGVLNNCSISVNSFDILDCLGAGSFGKVFKVRMKSNGVIYAMKVINKKFLMKNNQLRYAITECNVLKQVTSPFILTLYYSFQTPENLYLIIDYCPGGDLNFHIVQNLFEEDEARFYIAELISIKSEVKELKYKGTSEYFFDKFSQYFAYEEHLLIASFHLLQASFDSNLYK